MPNAVTRRGLPARRAEAAAIVTRMGQDRASGLGSPQDGSGAARVVQWGGGE